MSENIPNLLIIADKLEFNKENIDKVLSELKTIKSSRGNQLGVYIQFLVDKNISSNNITPVLNQMYDIYIAFINLKINKQALEKLM